MIKTTQPVSVETKDKRDVEEKTVYAEITNTSLKPKGGYLISINEFVYDEVVTWDEDNQPITIQQKRSVLRLPRVRTDEQIRSLIAILKDDNALLSYGLSDIQGVYDTLDQVDKNMFVLKYAHLIENNADTIRGTTWELTE